MGTMKGSEMPTSGSHQHPPTITVYTTPHCHWCRVAKHYLAEHGIEYREVDVSRRGAGRREMALMTGGHAVPVIRVGEHAMTGWDEREFRKLLDGKFKQR
jgi:glutaredoxin 3